MKMLKHLRWLFSLKKLMTISHWLFWSRSSMADASQGPKYTFATARPRLWKRVVLGKVQIIPWKICYFLANFWRSWYSYFLERLWCLCVKMIAKALVNIYKLISHSLPFTLSNNHSEFFIKCSCGHTLMQRT